MFEGLYSNITHKYPQKLKKQGLYPELEKGELTLDVFLEEGRVYDFQELGEAFIRNLKELLEEDQTLLLIEKISLLDGVLKKLKEFYTEEEVPSLTDFYQDLSPVLMQKYWELNLNPPSKEAFDSLFLHSLHIALEEEIYIWQEKIN